MTSSLNNPASNEPEEKLYNQLKEAVKNSGYPLQTRVAAQLQPSLTVVEEWGYIDRNQTTRRALDIFAHRRLCEKDTEDTVIPTLILLIECKQSRNPYVFFKSITANNRNIRQFPKIYGLSSEKFWLNVGSSAKDFHISKCLGLSEHEFVDNDIVISSVFAAARPKGKDTRDGKQKAKDAEDKIGPPLELSGDDTFNGIVLPLISATEYARKYYKPLNTLPVYFARLVLSICVIDAPLIVAETRVDETNLEPVSWVRAFRQEADPDSSKSVGLNHFVIDVVRYDYLAQFINQHVIPFAEVYAQRVLQNQKLFLSGHGRVANLDNWKWSEIH
jgi:hypothetical protein